MRTLEGDLTVMVVAMVVATVCFFFGRISFQRSPLLLTAWAVASLLIGLGVYFVILGNI